MVRLLGVVAVTIAVNLAIPSALAGSKGRWIDIGPAPLAGGQIGLIGHERPVTGRVSAVAINPEDSAHWLVGGAVGGVWETTNAGRSWRPLTDDAPSLAIGAIAFAPRRPDIVYVGTGEALPGTSALPGRGMLRLERSAKHGTWTMTGVGTSGTTPDECAKAPFSGLGFSAISVDPDDPTHVVAATRHVGTETEGISVDLHKAIVPRDACKRGIVRFKNGKWETKPELRGDANDLVVRPGKMSFGCMYAGLSRTLNVKPDELGDFNEKKPMPGVYRRRDDGCDSGRAVVVAAPDPLPADCRLPDANTGAWKRIDGPWNYLACAKMPKQPTELWKINWNLFLARPRIAVARNAPDTLYVAFSTHVVDKADSVKQNLDAKLLGLWRTTNAWSEKPAWVQIPVGATDGGSGMFGYCASNPPTGLQMQCNWNHVLSVDPNNANVIYAGGVGLWRGTITCEHTRKDDNKNLVLVDRCIDWVEVSQTLAPHPPTPRLRRIGIHVDQHAMEWTADARRLVVGNDGGVWSTTDSGRSWNAHNHGLSVMQFYRGAVADATDGSGPIMLGGTQDNGVARWRGGSWDWVLGGDGGAALISKKRPDTHWAVTTTSVLFGKRMRRSVDGKQFPFANDPSLIDDTEPSLDVLMKPLAACPWNDDVVVVAGQGSLSALAPKLKALWKSESFFTTPASPTWRPNFTEEQVDIDAQGLISAVAFAASGTSCDTYAFGTKAGAVWLTTKGGKFWCHIGTQLEVPTSTRITGMGFDPSGRLYVSLVDLTSKRFGLVAHTDAPIPACVKDELIKPSWHYVPLVRSTDQNPGCFPDSTAGGPREQHASPACPTGTRIMDDREHVNTIALHPRVPGLMYAGTNAGVWVSHDHGATWTRHDHSTYGMPNVPVLDIKISPSGRHVVAFTYGRGAFLWEGRGWCDGQPSSAIGTNFRPCPR